MTFLENIEEFEGNGARNEAGQTLKEFLDAYDATKYRSPSNTVDNFVLSCDKKIGSEQASYALLMVKRKNHPCIGYWALPGGFVDMRESLENAAKRELEEETGLTGIDMEQIYTWGAPERDPRTRVITTVYAALLEDGQRPVKAGDDAAQALWFGLQLRKVSQGEEGEWILEHYELQLENQQNNIRLKAEILRKYKKDKAIKQETFSVVSTDAIASDHGAIIVQAFLKLNLA